MYEHIERENILIVNKKIQIQVFNGDTCLEELNPKDYLSKWSVWEQFSSKIKGCKKQTLHIQAI